MSRIALYTACVASLMLCGCSRNLQISLPDNAPIRIAKFLKKPGSTELEANEFSVPPAAPAYRQLQEWMKKNQSGWSSFKKESSNEGIFVYGPGFQLQFVEERVFLRIRQGTFSKKVAKQDYAFLNTPPGT